MELKGISCTSLEPHEEKKEKIVVYQDLLEKKVTKLEDLKKL